MRYALILALLLVSFSCQAGTIRPDKSDKEYIEYGKKHECVVPFRGESKTDDGKTCINMGSAVLVSPTVIITAAHLLQDIESSYVLYNGKKHDIDFSVFPKEFLEKIHLSSFDIAICHLTKPINIDFYPELYESDDEAKKICSIAGYGLSGTHRTGAVKEDYKKRAGSNQIDEIINDNLLKCSLMGGDDTELEFLICQGDSGGGLFIDQKLAGINSCIYTSDKDKKLNADYKDCSTHTRISYHRVWLNTIMEAIKEYDEKQKG